MVRKELIIAEMSSFIESSTPTVDKSSVYVGVTFDIEKRLFQQHAVDKESKDYKHFKCSSSGVAREIEDYLIVKYGTKGDTGGGDDNADYVYVYKMNGKTNP